MLLWAKIPRNNEIEYNFYLKHNFMYLTHFTIVA